MPVSDADALKLKHQAVGKIQHAWRNRGKPRKKNTFRWPTLFELKAMYLDADAVEAGAEGSELCSARLQNRPAYYRRGPGTEREHGQVSQPPPTSVGGGVFKQVLR